MRKLFLLAILLCTFYGVNAQASLKDTIISFDTINVRGVVYDNYSKPVKNVAIGWSGIIYRQSVYSKQTITDDNGYFELKGVPLDEALKIIDYPTIFNNNFRVRGSRYMVIYLPPPATTRTPYHKDSTILVSARRVAPKVSPLFKVLNDGVVFAHSQYIFSSFKGGEPGLINYLKKSIVYPANAIKNNIEGVVEIGFRIQAGGLPGNFRVLKGLGYGCDEEVIKRIKNGGKWDATPVPMAVEQIVAVEFKLSDK